MLDRLAGCLCLTVALCAAISPSSLLAQPQAAVAALNIQAPVIERFGLQGFGAHSADAEYVLISSIPPRLYLATQLVMDIASGKAR